MLGHNVASLATHLETRSMQRPNIITTFCLISFTSVTRNIVYLINIVICQILVIIAQIIQTIICIYPFMHIACCRIDQVKMAIESLKTLVTHAFKVIRVRFGFVVIYLFFANFFTIKFIVDDLDQSLVGIVEFSKEQVDSFFFDSMRIKAYEIDAFHDDTPK
jgi:hypothetical protein